MIKEFAWKAFENTGDLNTYLLFKEIEKLSEDDEIIVENEYKKQEELSKIS